MDYPSGKTKDGNWGQDLRLDKRSKINNRRWGDTGGGEEEARRERVKNLRSGTRWRSPSRAVGSKRFIARWGDGHKGHPINADS